MMSMDQVQPDISLLIAVYNGASFMEQCLNSVLEQQFSGTMEIIVVDDASTDDSFAIASKFAEKDARVRIIRHQENKRLGSTRNTGLQAAKGKYVCFLDVDDYLEPDYCQQLFDAAERFGAEVVQCAYWIHLEEHPDREPLVSEFGTDDKDQLLRAIIMGRVPGFSWNKIYLREFILRHSLKFQPKEVLTHGEDRLFSVQCLYLADKVKFVPQPLHHYFVRKVSMSGSYRTTLVEDILAMDKVYEEFFRKHGRFEELHPFVDNALIKGVVSVAYNELRAKSGYRFWKKRLMDYVGTARVQKIVTTNAHRDLPVGERQILSLIKLRLLLPLYYLLQLKLYVSRLK